MRGPRSLGVRTRVQTSFALGGLLVSVFLAAVSWGLTTTYLQDQREITATRGALVSADLVARRLSTGDPLAPAELREAASLGNDAFYLPADRRGPVSATPRVAPGALPADLVALAASGRPAQQRLELDGAPVLAVALPVPSGVYVELFPLDVLDRTLRGLSLVLAATAVLATVLAAAVGRWAAHRTLRPLRALVQVAGRVAQGDLDTRLDAGGDPDLVPLAEAFNSTTAALQARTARDARFASDVSHELRSPVTTMLNAAELLDNRRDELSPRGQEALDLLHAEVQRFRVLVEDLLVVSRDDQQADLAPVPLDLGRLARRVVDLRVPGAPVTVAPGVEGVLVDADPRRLERVLSNLVDNACVHGGGLRDVTVRRADRAVRVEVRDVGEGVPAHERERVFERFYRGQLSRARTAGSGLGLAIAQQHVGAHGGRLWVEDAQPRGAVFVVELPVPAPAEGPVGVRA